MDAFREHETGEVTSENSVIDRSLVSSLLRPASKTHPPTEEQLHPWCVGYSQTFDVPLLRIWDQRSGSRPDANTCLMSRAPRQRLDTAESRRAFLATHIDHSNWTPTPFISFTTSATAVTDLADMRENRKRGAQHLTAIDPNIRLAAGLPILDFSAEANYYNIADPYGKSNQYCKDHYLCLWEVSGREIVRQWDWDDLAVHWNWYDEIVMPAFRKFRSEFVSKSLRNESSDLSTAIGKLSRQLAISQRQNTLKADGVSYKQFIQPRLSLCWRFGQPK